MSKLLAVGWKLVADCWLLNATNSQQPTASNIQHHLFRQSLL